MKSVDEVEIVSTVQRNLAGGFYWIGVAMALACLALILAGNTELLYRLEHTGFPLAWAFAGAAVFAFLAAEICGPASSLPHEEEDLSPQTSSEWETADL